MSLLRGGRYREGVNHSRALRLVPVVAGAVFVGIMALSCDAEGDGASISFQRTEASQPTSAFEPAKEAILFATAAVNSPEETFALYGELLGYLGDKLDRPVRLVQGKTYAEINELVRSGDVTLAIVCSAPYVLGHDQFGMEALVVPQVKGKTTYHSYIIASRDSPAESFEDLRGRTFAFSDPMSNSGRLVPLYMLWQIRETPESFFSRYIFTYSHDNSIKAVATGLVDGAAVDSLVYDYAAERNPRYVRKTKVIHVSPPYGINPVVVNPRLDPELKSQIRSVLLGMNEDPEGQRILEGLMFDRFVPADDSAYDSIREMLATLNRGQAMPDPGGE